MLTRRHNRHYSSLPAPGAIVRVLGLADRGINPKHKWRVLGFPLNDNVAPYSLGVHTVLLQNLSTRETHRVSGFYCEEVEDAELASRAMRRMGQPVRRDPGPPPSEGGGCLGAEAPDPDEANDGLSPA